MENENLVERSRVIKWHTHVSDFANMVKAFIGSNYLGVSFAFSQSGLAAGIVGLIIIAILTDHCCHLIVKCKNIAISKIIENEKSVQSKITDEKNSAVGPEILQRLEKQMKRNLTYGDVGRLSMGTTGLYLVNACVFLTQFGFCVGYFILIGNTVREMFPLKTCDIFHNITNTSDYHIMNCQMDHIIEEHHLEDAQAQAFSASFGDQNVTGFVDAPEDYDLDKNNSVSNISWTPLSKHVYMYSAPSLKLLVLIPLPIFIIFSYIRDIRQLGPISIAANLSIFVGCISIMIFLVNGFIVNPAYVQLRLETLPVFFGLVAGAFEGIGTVIPIESSMEGNRHNFSAFLHGAIGLLSFVLTLFGILGYLRFGEGVRQMLNANLVTGSNFSIIVNVCLCVGIILTFPLMMYPVLEITEIYTFADGRIFGPKKKKSYDDDDDDEISPFTDSTSSNDRESLLPNNSTSTNLNFSIPVAATVSPEVAAWKRNIVRALLVLVAAGLAVIFRDSFAYILAFVGAIGSTLLAFILPCVFHLKLSWTSMSIFIKLKNFVIVIIGTFCSVVSVYTTVSKIVDNTAL